MMYRSTRLAFALAFSSILLARHPATPECGTYAGRAQEEIYLHQRSERGRAAAARLKRMAAARAANTDAGNIAIIDDGDGVVSRRNPFNLVNKTVVFAPAGAKAASYTVDSSAGYTYIDNAGGTPLDMLQDDDTTEVRLPFAFPFYGRSHGSVWVNSNGNLTFGGGDGNTTSQTLGRLIGGAPRIAALFEDLDPSAARNGAVRVLAEAGRFVVTFDRIPEYSDFGFGQEQTFQFRLYPSGRIEIAYDEITALDAVVGIAPGNLKGTLALVTLSLTNPGEYSGAVAEVFAGSPSIDIAAAAQKFYATHEDSYDYLVFYNALGVAAAEGAVAWESTVRNRRTGYGDTLVETGEEYGSAARLQAVINMGPIQQYPANPDAPVPLRAVSGDTPLTVLGHEAGHLFLAFTSVRDPANPSLEPMLGRAGAHWAFTYNSEASLLEGNRIRDNGESAVPRFTTIKTVEGYSPLDQYLMGFIPPAEVPPTFYVANASVNPSRAPQNNVNFNGVRRNVAVEEVIAVAGRRTPDHSVAQRKFRFAFVLVVPAGSTAAAEQVAQVDAYRVAFEAFYAKASGNHAVADTTLRRALRVSTWPAAGVVQGATATGTVRLASEAAAPVTLLIERQSGLVEAPASITVPAGQRAASFAYRGLRAGVEELTLRAADSSYESVTSRIQVLPSASALRLSLAGGNSVFRVSDENDLPYPGVTLTAGTRTAVTGDQGTASFEFEPGTTVAVAIQGVPASAITITVPARPVVSAITNAASYAAGITANSYATIFGANLGAAVQVLVNGELSTITYVSGGQINFRVPAELSGATAGVTVVTPALASIEYRAPVLPVSPGIFAVVNRGTALEIYANGLNGSAPVVTIGGVEVKVLYVGQPQFPGLDQVNVLVAGAGPGAQPVTITAGGVRSNTVTVTINP